MKSKTKRKVPQSAVTEMLRAHSLGEAVEIKEMGGGYFNTVLKVKTDDGKCYAIKIAPNNSSNVLTYEKELIKSEVEFYRLLQNVKSVHFPEIYGFSTDENQPYQYLIMEFIEGKMMSEMRLSSEQKDKYMYDLGVITAEIHKIKNDSGFGYLQNGLKQTWAQAYTSMVENLITDAERKNAEVPFINEIRKAIEKNRGALEEVKSPSLVHFDIWAGNVIIKDGKIRSVIDCERAMFGDVMGEFISLQFSPVFSITAHKSLFDGYNSAAENPVTFSKTEMARINLMRVYLSMIMYIETYYRRPRLSPVAIGTRAYARTVLKACLKELG